MIVPGAGPGHAPCGIERGVVAIIGQHRTQVVGAELHPFGDLFERSDRVGAARLDGEFGTQPPPAAFDAFGIAFGKPDEPLADGILRPDRDRVIGRPADRERSQASQRQHRDGKPDSKAEQASRLRNRP